MNKDELKFQIVSKLATGSDPREIATELDTPYTKVLRIRKEFEAAKAANDLDTFIDMDAVLVKQLLAEATANMPAGLAESAAVAAGEITKVKSKLDGLSDDMILTAVSLTNHIKIQANNIDHVSELEALTSALCNLQNAFFNSNKTQVNIQQNYGDASSPANSYGSLLSDKPANN